MNKPLYAILIDGGFITKKIRAKIKVAVSADDIVTECQRLKGIPEIADYELLRIYYYDAPPSLEAVSRPVSKSQMNLSTTERARHAQSLHDQLVIKSHFALRMGETALSVDKWKLKQSTSLELLKSPRALVDDDFQLDVAQKGVDLRIGLDMARLALRDMVRSIIVVTGDSDFVPAFKFVRREGVKVILDPMGHSIKPALREHSDVVL